MEGSDGGMIGRVRQNEERRKEGRRREAMGCRNQSGYL